MTVLISIINILIRNLIYCLVNYIGYHTESERVNAIMKAIFVTVFINTGILNLIVNANFEFYPYIYSILPFKRQYTDFGKQWYLD